MDNIITETKRSELPDSVFGIPEERKYPLHDEKHVRSAIKLFNHVDQKYEKQLANKIIAKMKEYDITPNIGDNNRLKKYINESVESVYEGFLFSKNNLYINYDKFQSGDSNVLLITGLSGSGKSTLGNKVARENKAEFIELDLFEQSYMFENNNQLKEAGMPFYEYLTSHKELREKLKKKEIRGKELGLEIEKFLKYCISYCKKDKETKYVIEGVQIYSFLNKNDLSSLPIIFVNTSMLQSMMRRIKRSAKNGEITKFSDIKNLEIPQMLMWYIDNEKSYSQFQKAVLNESESQADLTKFTWYHAEIAKKGFNAKNAGGWDEELYSKSIESCIHNDIEGKVEFKGADKISAHLYTAGEDLTAIYLGRISIWRASDNNKLNWEWEEQIPMKSSDVAYLKDEVQRHLGESSIITEDKKSDYSFHKISTKKDIELYWKYAMALLKIEYKDLMKEGQVKQCIEMIYFKNKPIGFISGKANKNYPNHCYISNLMIISEHQRKGHGRNAIKEYIEQHKDEYDNFFCYVNMHDTNAISFYKSIGADVYMDKPFTDHYYYVVLYDKIYGPNILNESTEYIEEGLGVFEIAFLVFMAAMYGFVGYEKLKEYLDKNKRETGYRYYCSNKPLMKIPSHSYYNDILYDAKGALISHAYVMGIRKAEKNTLIYNTKSDLNGDVYLYRYTWKEKKMELVRSGKYSEICSSYGIKFKALDESKLKDREKAYKIAIDNLKKEIVTYTDLKKHCKIGPIYDDDYMEYSNGLENSIIVLNGDVWDIVPNARSDEGHDLIMSKIRNPEQKIIENINKKLPEGYLLEEHGDWDDICIVLVHNSKINESSVEDYLDDDEWDEIEEWTPVSFLSKKTSQAKNKKAHRDYLKQKQKSHKKKYNFFHKHEAALYEDMKNNIIEAEPIFIINSFTNTPFGKIITTYSKSAYSHTAISLDTSLTYMYTFNADNKKNAFGGFSIESIEDYIAYYKDSTIQVNCIFIKKEDMEKIKFVLDNMAEHIPDTRYGFKNIFNIVLNKAKEMTNDAKVMVCSQFVAYILHNTADIRLVNKSDNLVTPKDLSNIDNPRVYKLYEGKAVDYDEKKINRIFRKLKTKAMIIKESLIGY